MVRRLAVGGGKFFYFNDSITRYGWYTAYSMDIINILLPITHRRETLNANNFKYHGINDFFVKTLN